MNQFKGTWLLVKLALRRDRIKLPVAIASIVLIIPMFMAAIKEVFAEGEESVRQILSLLAANPVMRLFGLPTGEEMGNFFMLRTFTFIAIVVALISVFTVVRHTRQNEEKGRTELLGSSVVGRHASLAAAMVVVVAMNIVIALLAYLGLLNSGLDTTGTLAMSLGWGAVGIAFGGIAAVCAQLTKSSSGANSLAAASIGVAFSLAGIGSVLGDLQSDGFMVEPMWLTWLSPIGWGQLLYPFAGENWWMLMVFVVFAVFAIGLAMLLTTKRDIGSGLLQSRAGRATAKNSLLSPAGLAWRLNRGVLLGWIVGITLLGVVYGAVASGVEELFAQAEGFAEIFLASSGTEEMILAYLGTVMGIIGVFALAYTIQVSLRLRSEENRALESLLSTSTSRHKWILVNFGFIALSTALLLLFAGLGVGIAAQLALVGEMNVIWPVIAGALVQLPAILLISGLVVSIFGIWPQLSYALAWVALGVSVLLGPLFSAMLSVPEWLVNFSPLSHTPVVPPTANIEVLPLMFLSIIALSLLTLGLAAFRKRDLSVN